MSKSIKNFILFFTVAMFFVIASKINYANDVKEIKIVKAGAELIDVHQDSSKHNKKEMMHMDSHKMHQKDSVKEMNNSNSMDHNHKNMMHHSNDDTSVVRTGKIDLQSIDKNNDGKVFQDMMDWNVISDEPGNCPQCGMKLKEVSLQQAKENLEKHDYEVK